MRSLLRLLFQAMLAAALLAACLDNVMAVVPERIRWQVRLGLVVVALLGLGETIRRWLRRLTQQMPAAAAPDPSGACGPSRRDILTSANLVLDRYESAERYATGERPDEDPSPIYLFARLLVELTHLARVSEDVRLSGDLMAIDVTVEVSIDALRHEPDEPGRGLKLDGKIVVPILRRKDLVLETFEARDSADNKLTPLPQRLTDGLLAWTVKSLYELTYGEDLSPEDLKKIYKLTALFCRTDIVDPDVFAREYDAIVGAAGEQGGLDLLRSVRGYFAVNTVSAFEVDVAEADLMVVRYRYLATADRITTAHDRYRTRLGLRPYRYVVPISLAYQAHSYDLRITGPDSHFVYRHLLREAGTTGKRTCTPAELAPTAGMGVRLDADHGAPYAGVHTRGLNRAEQVRNVECAVEFEEIPPGALRRSLVISAVGSLVLIAFAFAVPAAVQDSRGTDLAALLLAAPGLVATLVGFSTDRVQQSSLTAFGGLVVSAVLSFTASVLYLLQTLVWPGSPTVRLSLLYLVRLPAADAIWIGLAFVSLSTTLFLALQGVHRMRRYLFTLRRRSAVGRTT
ncbi:hypothetical protein [Winogradskya consettensis]|nr:hypothetical protein [Actinoplanes consettensis]